LFYSILHHKKIVAMLKEDNNQFKLIDGEFTPAEAAKILFSLINYKIKHHSLESFSNEIRFEKDTSNAKKRIVELQEAHASIQQVLEQAEEKGLKLNVTSQITIKFLDTK